jgi:putative oxidoreductase
MITSEGTKSGPSHFFLNALRIGAGLTFMQHGAQNLFGALGGQNIAEFPSQFWLAGMLEMWGGLLIVLGLFTRPVAFVLAGEMAGPTSSRTCRRASSRS